MIDFLEKYCAANKIGWHIERLAPERSPRRKQKYFVGIHDHRGTGNSPSGNFSSIGEGIFIVIKEHMEGD